MEHELERLVKEMLDTRFDADQSVVDEYVEKIKELLTNYE